MTYELQVIIAGVMVLVYFDRAYEWFVRPIMEGEDESNKEASC